MATAKQDPTPAAAAKVAVILRSASKPGIKRCGPYEPDRIYTVDAAEARRLVEDKGFEYSTTGDKTVATTKEG